MYNDTHFPSNSKYFTTPPNDQPSCQLDTAAFQVHDVRNRIPAADKLFYESDLPSPTVEETTNSVLNPISDPVNFSNKLFFVQYTPEGTLRARWYLIQVDMESTLEVNPHYATDSLYWCVFLARHPDDNKKSDELCRWWPDWYRYKTCVQTNDIIYGDRILIRPNAIPCKTKFIQWATLLTLCGPDTVSLAGPFNFEAVDESNRVRQKVHHSHWSLLIDACALFGITPPTIGSPSLHKRLGHINHSSQKRPRLC